MKTYQDVETFKVRFNNLKFEEKFTPIEDFSWANLSKIRTFLHIIGLRWFAAGKLIHFVPGIPKVRPSIWYVRMGFGKYLPCSTNEEMDLYTRSLVTK